MKLSPTLLRNLTITAGIAATLSTATADEKATPPAGGAEAKPAPNDAVSPEAQAFFLRHDTNKDGKLSLEEFDKAFAEIRQAAKVAPRPAPQVLPPGDGCPACGLG
ncbi:MAG: hypothetical protein ACKO2G_05945 [Verrucomicrobiales bacterium]